MPLNVASPSLASGTIVGDTYRIVKWVGAGGMGELYEAVHLRLAGPYAIKVLHGAIATIPNALARFKREAEITSQLRHPNIVNVLDFNVTPDGRPYLAMELLEGVELRQRMYAGAMALDEVLGIVGQIASALTMAHGRGVIHRDLKPQNVFLTVVPYEDREVVKVVDFGISKVIEASLELTLEATILGTPQYMAPEQALGKLADIDERTDQFALAAMTYEMLSGQPAFQGANMPSVLYQVVHEHPRPLTELVPGLPAGIEPIIARGLAKARADRFPSVREFHRALVDAAAKKSAPAPATPVESPRKTTILPQHELLQGQGATRWLEQMDGSQDTQVETTSSTLRASAVEAAVVPRPSPAPRVALAAAVVLGGAVAVWAVLPRRADESRETRSAMAPDPFAARPPVPAPAPAQAPLRPVEPAPRGATQAPASAPSVPPATQVTLSAAPPGLTVTVDGAPATLPLELARGEGTHRLRFEAPGYVSYAVEVKADRERHAISLAVMKRRKPPAPAEPANSSRTGEADRRQTAEPEKPASKMFREL